MSERFLLVIVGFYFGQSALREEWWSMLAAFIVAALTVTFQETIRTARPEP